MILVWLTYLHLLLIFYRRQRRPKVLNTRGRSQDITAHWLISNMRARMQGRVPGSSPPGPRLLIFSYPAIQALRR